MTVLAAVRSEPVPLVALPSSHPLDRLVSYSTMGGILAEFRLAQERRGLCQSTIAHRHIRLTCWLRWVTEWTADDVTSEDVERFLDSRRLSDKTRYGWLSTLHAFYRWQRRQDPMVIDPTETIERPKVRQGIPRPIPTADLRYAVAASNPRQRAALILAAYAGMRCAEIAHIERDWIDEATGIIRIVGKGRKERIVDLHPIVADALHRMGLPRAGRVFRTTTGLPCNPDLFTRHLNDHLHDLGLSATMHQLRHWFGTEAYLATKDLRAVQELMGHASPTTTALYTKLDREAGRAAVLALPVLTSILAVA